MDTQLPEDTQELKNITFKYKLKYTINEVKQ
jgi:hypothetical protein